MSSINTHFQQQAADLIIGLINNDLIVIDPDVFDLGDDEDVFMFYLYSYETHTPIAMVQQIVHKQSPKEAKIFISGINQNWDSNIVQQVLDVLFEKTNIKKLD